jgi:DNA-binding transcriptional LysR family regulator
MHLKEMDANLLVVLDALLIDASVTKAAERLGRSPSAISHALANLRVVFGDELFVRAGQRLAPTAKAIEIAPTIHVIVTGIESLLRPAAPFDPATQERDFTVLCRETSEFTLLQPLRARLKEKASGVSLAVSGFDADGWTDKLRLGQGQFAVVEAMENTPSAELHSNLLFEDVWVTLAAKNHPVLTGPVDGATFAAQNHVVITAPPEIQEHLRSTLVRYRVAPGSITWASSLFAGLFLALESKALVTLPASIARAIQRHVQLVPVPGEREQLRSKTFLIWHRSNDRDECHAWLRGEIAACAASV